MFNNLWFLECHSAQSNETSLIRIRIKTVCLKNKVDILKFCRLKNLNVCNLASRGEFRKVYLLRIITQSTVPMAKNAQKVDPGRLGNVLTNR